ncbi:hypothetical protein GJAV_G00044240 [Gymnothorax javanicus]|nr:hypothetical protein GJAV_G00044240 [Gymnothorax javanicus]
MTSHVVEVNMQANAVQKKEKLLTTETEGKTDWKRWKAERKEQKKKQKEAKLIKQLEKQVRAEEQQNQLMVQQQQQKSKGHQYTGRILRVWKENSRVLEKRAKLVCRWLGFYSIWNVPSIFENHFFPKHQDLQFAGLLNPLDSPHHMRMDEDAEFREGVILDRPSKAGKGSFVNCGLRKEVQIDKQLQAGLRVTVRLNKTQIAESKVLKGTVVAPHTPRTEGGLYWGYIVRLASGLSSVFTECPYKDGYDLTIGTSERGSNIDCLTLSPFKHMLVVFGGLQGLEASVDSDQNLDVTDPSVLFDLYLNTCPCQGSRTIRTEEAVLISLSGLRSKIVRAFMDHKT